jgi:hypothetical protein
MLSMSEITPQHFSIYFKVKRNLLRVTDLFSTAEFLYGLPAESNNGKTIYETNVVAPFTAQALYSISDKALTLICRTSVQSNSLLRLDLSQLVSITQDDKIISLRAKGYNCACSEYQTWREYLLVLQSPSPRALGTLIRQLIPGRKLTLISDSICIYPQLKSDSKIIRTCDTSVKKIHI